MFCDISVFGYVNVISKIINNSKVSYVSEASNIMNVGKMAMLENLNMTVMFLI